MSKVLMIGALVLLAGCCERRMAVSDCTLALQAARMDALADVRMCVEPFTSTDYYADAEPDDDDAFDVCYDEAVPVYYQSFMDQVGECGGDTGT